MHDRHTDATHRIDPPEDPVERLLGEALLRWETDGQTGLDELCRAHPEHAVALREALRLLDGARLLPEASPVPQRLDEFTIVARLGSGGMGAVFLATQESLGRRVALKLMRPELAFFGSNRERFRREAEAIARLQHPAIVPIHAWGEAQGLPYFAMEYIEGCSLAAALAEVAGRNPADLDGDVLAAAVARRAGSDASAAWDLRGPWVDVALRITLAIAGALQHAHDRSVLHRDVKPSNVMLGLDGRVRLVDFGLARTAGDAELTHSGAPLGSLAYMSPEQLTGRRDVDARTDVWSLGLVLHELLTLRRAFAADDAETVRAAILSGARPPLPRDLGPRRRDLETLCATATAVEPERRYASAAALADDVEAILAGRPIEARRAGPLERAWWWARRHRARAALLVVTAVLAPSAAVTAALWWSDRASSDLGRSYRDRVAAARDVTDAFFAYRLGARAEAGTRFEAVLANDPGSALALLGRLLCALSANDADDLDRTLNAHPTIVDAHPMFGWFRVEARRLQRRDDEATTATAMLPAEPPPHAVDWFVQGVRESWRGREGDASHFRSSLRAIEQAILLDRSEVRTPIFHVYAAEMAALCGDTDSARQAAKAIETLWPDSAMALAGAGRAIMAADGERSTTLLRRAVTLAPDRAVLHLYLAESLLYQSQYDAAEKAYEEALRGDERLGSAWGGLALLHLAQGRLDEAVRCSERYVAVEPDLGLAWRVRAQSLHLSKRWEEARTAYLQAVQRMPVDAVVHAGYVAVLEHLGEVDAANAERARFAVRR